MNHSSQTIGAYSGVPVWDESAHGHDELPPDVVSEFTVLPVHGADFDAIDAILELRRDPLVLAESAGIGWPQVAVGRDVSVALCADVPGQWMVYSQVAGHQQEITEQPWAHCPLSFVATTAVWRFFPDVTGPVSLWAYLYVDGRFVPFRAEPWAAHYVDLNGALLVRTTV